MYFPFASKWICACSLIFLVPTINVWADPIYIPLPSSEEPSNTEHIAVILPLNSPTFAAAAQSVQNGILSAAAIPSSGMRGLPVKFYPTEEGQDIQKIYLQASQAGAAVVIGGLNKADASLIALSPNPVPTIVLNTVYRTNPEPAFNLYSFSLSAEDEATQVASLAYNNGCRQAVSVSADTPLAQRVQTSFLNAWQLLGGTMLWARTVKQDKTELNDLRKALLPSKNRSKANNQNNNISYPECVLFASDAYMGRSLRPFIGNTLPIYATSMIDDGKRDGLSLGDLQGINYMDMPWLVSPNDPAWEVYPRPNQKRADLQRLYAFGIDAYHLAVYINNQQLKVNEPIQGATGALSLLENHSIYRELQSLQIPKPGNVLPNTTQE